MRKLTFTLILLTLSLIACSANVTQPTLEPERVADETQASNPQQSDNTPASKPQSPILNPQAPLSVWQPTNPGGGGWFAVAGAGPSGVILAGSDLTGAYRSLDRGQSWGAIGAFRGLTSTHVGGLGFHPTDPNILYIGTDDGLFRSDDMGETVQQVLAGGYVTDIEIARSNTQIGYTAVHAEWNTASGSVYKSSNNGQSWSQVSSNLPGNLRILKLLIHPTQANTVYLLSGEGRFATGDAVVYRSTDGGVTWAQMGGSLDDVLDIAQDKLDADTIYLSTYEVDPDLHGYLYKSDNSGTTWTEIAHRSGVIWPDAFDVGVIRLIDTRYQFPWDERNGMWETVDGGATWTQESLVEDWDFGWTNVFWAFESEIRGLGEDLSDPGAMFWASGAQWVFGTFDNGHYFQNLFTDEVTPGQYQSRGLDNVVMFDMAISEANPDDIYLGYFDIGCWHSSDRGNSWASCNNAAANGDWEENGGNTTTLAADPSREGVVWTAQTEDTAGAAMFLQSINAGENWTVVGNSLPTGLMLGLSVDGNSPTNNRILFMTVAGDVYRSQDDGSNWSLVYACGGCQFTAVDQFNSNLVYAGGGEGLFRSNSGGVAGSWTAVGLPEMVGTGSNDFFDWGWEGVFSITPDPHSSGTVYVAAFGDGKGVYRSQDGGDSWEKLLDDNYMRDTAVSPQDPNIIFATSSSAYASGGYEPDSHGILLSTDGGQSWTQQNEGMAWPFANPIVFDPQDPNTLFSGSPGTGFQRRSYSSFVTYLPVVLVTAVGASGIKLDWNGATGFESFDIWRGTSPDFTLSGSPFGAVNGSTQEFVDGNGRGDVNNNYFYLIDGIDSNGTHTLSNHTGEFDYKILANS